ncbi:MAG: hypothetical protein AABW51_05125 [Nanoarchaeota archaeon]
MTRTIDDQLSPKEPLKVRVAKAPFRAIGSSTKWAFNKAHNSVEQRSFDLKPGMYAFVLANYRLFPDDFSRDQALVLADSYSSVLELFENNRGIFAKGAKILGPKRASWYVPQPFDAYFKFPGQDIIIVDTKQRFFDPKPRTVPSKFNGFPIDANVNTRIFYRDHPLTLFQVDAGYLLQLRSLKNKKKIEATELDELIDGYRADKEEKIATIAYEMVFNHFAPQEYLDAVSFPLSRVAATSRNQNLQRSVGIQIEDISIEGAKIPESHDAFIREQIKYASNREAIREDLEQKYRIFSDLVNLKGSNYSERQRMELAVQFNRFLEASGSNQRISTSGIYNTEVTKIHAA